MSEEDASNTRNRFLKFETLKYGDFLFPGKRTYSLKKKHVPTIEELGDVLEFDDHYIPLGELLSRLDTDSQTGLREDQVASVRERYGENVVSVPEDVGVFAAFRNKVRGTYYLLTLGIVFCLITAAEPSLQTAEWTALDNVYAGLLMIFMILVSSCISYWQEKSSDRHMSSLKDFYPQWSVAIRDGKRLMVHRRDVVMGDLVRFRTGDAIPADLRLTQAWSVEVEEGPIRRKGGRPSLKTTECTHRNPALSQNVAFAGTFCVKGIGQGIVIATGDRTAYGNLTKRSEIFQKKDTPTHASMKNLRFFGLATFLISLLILLVCGRLVFWTKLAVLILCQVVASMQDVLYSATTVCFYETAVSMASRSCLPKNCEVASRLGSVSVICCNKTGTLTQGNMTVVGLWMDGKLTDATGDESAIQSGTRSATWKALWRTACLCSKTPIERRRDRGVIRDHSPGDQLEIAIVEFLVAVSESGSGTALVDSERSKHKKIFEIPFDSYRKYQVTVHEFFPEEKSAYLLCVKGAVDIILDFCSTMLIAGQSFPISHLRNFQFEEDFEAIMKDGEYIIGFCDLELSKESYPPGYVFQESNVPLFGLRFLGFVSVMDPPRANSAGAVARCRSAGIKVILMTGDHRLTAKAVARQVGIFSSGSQTKHEVAERFNISPDEVPPQGTSSAVITGTELETMDAKKLREHLRWYAEIAFARLNPRQKCEVIRCLREEGEVVAFAGRSTDDVPVLLEADVGIGMGKSGCDISRDTAEVILLGDNFESIVAGIEKGQQISKNLRNAIVYALSSNLPELSPLFAVCVLKIPFTMGAIFILFITLLADMIPVLLIVQENADSDFAKRNALQPSKCFNHRLVFKSYFQIGFVGLLSGLFVYFAIMAQNGFMPARVFGIVEMWNSCAINDLRDSYNQEWTYNSRKSLEYTCHTGFFLSIIILQWFNFGLLKRWKKPQKYSHPFLVACVLVPVCQFSVVLFLLYTPRISTALHFYPIQPGQWILCLPLPAYYLIYERLRLFIV